MAIAFRSAASATDTAATITVSKPAGTVEGDLLLVSLACDDQAEPMSPADGVAWITLNSDGNAAFTHEVLYKVAGASEPASYVFERDDVTSDPFAVSIACFSGVNPANPLDSNASYVRATSDTLNITAIDTTVANVMLVSLFGIPDASTIVTPPTNFTVAADNDGFQPGTAIAYLAQAVAGTSGTVTWVISASATIRGMLLALRPDAGYSYHSSIVGTAVNVDNGGSAITWSGPENVEADDGTSTVITLAGTAASDFLQGTDRGAALPVGSTIRGHEVVLIDRIRTGGTAGEGRDNVIQLLDGSGAAVGSNKALTSLNWATTAIGGARRIYGDPDDTWSAGLTVADVNDADSGVRIAVAGSGATTNRVLSIDAVRIITYYTPPAFAGTSAGVVRFTGALTGDYTDPEPDAPSSGGSGGRARRDRTRYGWVQPRFRREEEETTSTPAEPRNVDGEIPAPPSAQTPSTPTAEPEILATAPDPAEEALLLEVGVILLGLLDE